MKHWAILGVLASVAAGCGGGGDPIARADFSSQYAATVCTKIFDCCSAAEIMDMYDGITDQASCETSIKAFVEQYSGLDNDGVAYNADKAGDCLAAYGDVSCAALNAQSDADTEETCAAVLTGTLADGAACTISNECTGGYCNKTGTTGACETLPGEGQPCDFQCAGELVCKSDVCVERAANGTACDFDTDCHSGFCNDQSQCADEPASTTCDGN